MVFVSPSIANNKETLFVADESIKKTQNIFVELCTIRIMVINKN